MNIIVKLILILIFTQYLILLILLSNNQNKCNIKEINIDDVKYNYIYDIYKYDSMYSLIYKYHDNFITNKFNINEPELIKLNNYLKNNSDNYFAIGDKIIIYFYKNNNKYFINISPLFFGDISQNYKKIMKYYKNFNVIKILTKYKYNEMFNIFKYSNNNFQYINKKNIEKTFDIIYNLNYKNNQNKFILYGTCLGSNICCELYKYIKDKYKLNIKIITFETYFYEKPNFDNHINMYTFNSLFFWHSKINKYKIDYVFKIKLSNVIDYLSHNNLLFPIIEYDNYHHWKYHSILRKYKDMYYSNS
jgi:hypothetical protein